MGDYYLQLVKQHRKWLVGIALLAVFLAALIHSPSLGDATDIAPNAIKPLIKYDGKLYGLDEDFVDLPQDVVYVGKIEKKLSLWCGWCWEGRS